MRLIVLSQLVLLALAGCVSVYGQPDAASQTTILASPPPPPGPGPVVVTQP